MPAKRKFTRIPKTTDLMAAGVPVEAIPTYACLADHAHNTTGECWPSMARLAEILGKSVRTIQRHLHALKECGLVEFVERRRHKGRFSSYLYRVVFFVSTTGHGRRVGGRVSIYKRTKLPKNTQKTLSTETVRAFLGLAPGEERDESPPKKRTRADFDWFLRGPREDPRHPRSWPLE